MNDKNNKRMKTKDLISVAIFSLLFAILIFILAGVFSILPSTSLFYAGPAGILSGIVYMYLRVKVPKPGAVVLQGILTIGLYAIFGNPWITTVVILVAAVLAELASAIGKYRNFWWNTVGYVIFSLGIWGGKLSPVAISAQEYKEYCVREGMDAAYIDQCFAYMNTTTLTLAVLATIIGCVIGALIAKRLLKKHFQKIGAVS